MHNLFKKHFIKKSRMSDEMTLQITSMADIFTIILVFLLKSYATSAINVTPSSGMKLAESQGMEAPVEALKIEITEKSIQIENKPVVTLEQFRFGPNELQTDLSSKSLKAALEIERQRQKLISESNPSVKLDSKILIIADQRVPYTTIKSVLATAAINGFTDFKLVAVNKS